MDTSLFVICFFVLLISFVPAFFVHQYYSIKQWQRENHKELLIQQGKFSSKIYVAPSAP
jgi:membrane protein YdbS with pleckstrin-like domain